MFPFPQFQGRGRKAKPGDTSRPTDSDAGYRDAQIRGTWLIVKRNRNGVLHRREIRIREDSKDNYTLYNYSDGGRYLKKKFPLTQVVQVR